MDEQNIDPSSVILRRYSNGSWETLSTVKTKTDGNFVYFEASTPGFSPFAITGMSQSQTGSEDRDLNVNNIGIINSNELNAPESTIDETTEENNDVKSIPMLHPVFMILILLVVSILIRQQN
jgi:hypothetical protein